jgi:DNA-binding MarR family transcriptional regulator
MKQASLRSILDLDRMVHEPARLAILTVLSAAEQVEFLFLLKVTGLSKGNLSVQAQKLEAAGYLQTIKGYRGRIPVTSFKITPDGRTAMDAYHAQMRALLPEAGQRDDRSPAKASRGKARSGGGK